MAHDNAVLRHFIAKMVFPGGSDHQETTILEINTFVSDRETLEQPCWHSNCPFTVVKLSKHPDRSRNSRQPSRYLISILHSLISCILPQSLSFLGRHYPRVIRHFHKATWLDCQHSGGGNKNGIGCAPDQFFAWAKYGLGTRLGINVPGMEVILLTYNSRGRCQNKLSYCGLKFLWWKNSNIGMCTITGLD